MISRAIPLLVRACLVLVLAIGMACGGASDVPARTSVTAAVGQQSSRDVPAPRTTRAERAGGRASIGFRTRSQAHQHFQKHGAEFGSVTEAEYVRRAQALRDAPIGGPIEELKRPDGTVSRFDRASGAFVAFDSDGTIRTFFKPNTGESYFRRQAMRPH